MNARGLRRYVDDLLCGRRPRPFDADRFEAAQIRTAIELRAARPASDAPSDDFLTDLQRRLAAWIPGAQESADPLTDRTQHVGGGCRRGGRHAGRECRRCRLSRCRAHRP